MDNDPRNTLFREFLRVTQLIKPSLIIGENVKGLLSRKTTSGEPYIDVIVSEFQKLGYSVQYKVLRADDYGVPQKRERLIILGTLPNPDKQLIGNLPSQNLLWIILIYAILLNMI